MCPREFFSHAFLFPLLCQFGRGFGPLGEVNGEECGMVHGIPLPILHNHVIPKQGGKRYLLIIFTEYFLIWRQAEKPSAESKNTFGPKNQINNIVPL